MKRAALLVVMMALVLSATAWAQPRFDLIDLGVIHGPGVNPRAINRNGTMTGSAVVISGDEHLVLAKGGEVTDLGLLADTYTFGSGISNNGIVVGQGENATVNTLY